MPSAEAYLKQAAIFERVAMQCTIPELVGYYVERARECRERAQEAATDATATDASGDPSSGSTPFAD